MYSVKNMSKNIFLVSWKCQICLKHFLAENCQSQVILTFVLSDVSLWRCAAVKSWWRCVCVKCQKCFCVRSANCHRDEILTELEKSKVKFEVKSLKIGDFLWICRAQEHQELILPYVIERKRMDDFACSIKDGRCDLSIVKMFILMNETSKKGTTSKSFGWKSAASTIWSIWSSSTGSVTGCRCQVYVKRPPTRPFRTRSTWPLPKRRPTPSDTWPNWPERWSTCFRFVLSTVTHVNSLSLVKFCSQKRWSAVTIGRQSLRTSTGNASLWWRSGRSIRPPWKIRLVTPCWRPLAAMPCNHISLESPFY